MISRHEAAQRLDITLEMARKHGLPARISEQELDTLRADPPPWLAQSWANRTGAKPVWVQLTCDVCAFSESSRPKKWWPAFTYLSCADHRPDELPEPADGMARTEIDGIGSRFVGIVDAKP